MFRRDRWLYWLAGLTALCMLASIVAAFVVAPDAVNHSGWCSESFIFTCRDGG